MLLLNSGITPGEEEERKCASSKIIIIQQQKIKNFFFSFGVKDKQAEKCPRVSSSEPIVEPQKEQEEQFCGCCSKESSVVPVN